MTDDAHLVQLSRKGYRRVLTRLAYERLRFAVPLLAGVGLISSASGSSGAALLSFGALLGLPIAVWGLVSWQVYRPGRHALYEPTEYRFAEEGLVFGPGDARLIVEWSDFSRWREAAEHALLFVQGSQYVLIPLDELGAEDADWIRVILLERIGPAWDRSFLGRFRERRG